MPKPAQPSPTTTRTAGRRATGPAPEPGPVGQEAAPGDADAGRTARKRRAILDAATGLFLRDGYRNTSMDQIAAHAAVSKQTVYKQFADKEKLFREIVSGVTGNSEAIIAELTAALRAGDATSREQLDAALTDLARRYIDGVLQPHVLALRRLIIAEADRFPDLAHSYFEHAPARGIAVIAEALRTYADRGLLATEDPELAAAHFAYLTLAIPLDRAYFYPDRHPSRTERNRLATEAVRVFLAAYAAPTHG